LPMSTPPHHEWLTRSAGKPFAYLTTFGRRTGKPHRIEIWFAVDGENVMLLAGGRDRSDWVRNIQANPGVMIELGNDTRPGIARIIEPDTREDRRARHLLVEKYAKGDNLVEWGRTSLPVMIEFPPDTRNDQSARASDRG